LPQAEIDDAADFMLRIIERYSGNVALLKPIDVSAEMLPKPLDL
jgi:hypothetical protein